MKHSVEEVELKNGAKGLLVDIPNATVMNTIIQFRAGMEYAKNDKLHEIAHVMEHVSFGANGQFPNEQAYEAEFTKNGAYHNAWTSDTSICYETECADFEWDRILELKRVALTSPRFNEEELTSEKRNVRTELLSYMEEYPRLIWPRLQQAVGQDIPDLKERIATIKNIELRDIREHYRRTHTAKNMRFVIAGKLKHRKKQIVRMLEDWRFPRDGERLPLKQYNLHSSPAVSIRRKDAKNISFGFSWLTPRTLETTELFDMSALNVILNGTMTSRIFGQARKRGLVYDLWSDRTTAPDSSSWDFGGKVDEENAEALFDLIQEQMTKVLNGEITEEEIEATKSYLLGRYQMGAQTVGAVAMTYASAYFDVERVLDYEGEPNLIRKISKEGMVKLAREFVDAEISAMVTVSSSEKALINALAARLAL